MNIIFLMETMYLTHPACRLHEMGSWHPESPQRLDAISDQLLASGLMPYQTIARRRSLARHSAGPYRSVLDSLRQHVPEHGYYPIDPDTLMNPHTYEAALHAARAWPRSTRSWAARRAPLLCGASARTMPAAPRPWAFAS